MLLIYRSLPIFPLSRTDYSAAPVTKNAIYLGVFLFFFSVVADWLYTVCKFEDLYLKAGTVFFATAEI